MLMRWRSRRRTGSGAAITDLYNPDTGQLLLQYPVWFLLTLGLVGVGAFALTGFLGYGADSAFSKPWILFLWFCALLITLQVSIFRAAELRVRLIATLVVTVICIVLVILAKYGNILPDFIQQLIHPREFFTALADEPWTYTIANFGLLAVFWVDTLRRWIRRARGMTPNPSVTITLGTPRKDAEEMATLEELISGDLIAAFVLAFVLSLVLQTSVLQPLHPTITNCTISLPGTCVGAGDGNAFTTLAFIDRIQSLIYLPLGLIVLALTATLSGLGAAGGVSSSTGAVPAAQTLLAAGERAGIQPIATTVADTVIQTLRSALDRRLRHLLTNLALSLRNIFWPVLIFVAVYALEETATITQQYLHSAKSLELAFFLAGPALIWGGVAALGLAFSAGLFLFHLRVVDNTLRFLGLVGFVLLLTLWIFSLSLAGFNQLLLSVNGATISSPHGTPTPFLPLGASTFISLGALVVYGVIALVRRGRRPTAPSQPQDGAPQTERPQYAAPDYPSGPTQ